MHCKFNLLLLLYIGHDRVFMGTGEELSIYVTNFPYKIYCIF